MNKKLLNIILNKLYSVNPLLTIKFIYDGYEMGLGFKINRYTNDEEIIDMMAQWSDYISYEFEVHFNNQNLYYQVELIIKDNISDEFLSFLESDGFTPIKKIKKFEL
jgi:hypothetical protein